MLYGTNSRFATGIVTGESSYVLTSKREQWDGTSRVVLACHNATGNALFADPVRAANNGVHPYLAYLASQGNIVISSLWGGDLYGNDTQTSLLKEAADWGQANGGLNAPVGLFGWSAGACSALNFWRRFPAEVHTVSLVTPIANLTNAYADNASLQASIDAAFGGSYATNGTTFSPHSFAATLPYRPTIIWYADDDATIRDEDVESLATTLGAPLFDMAPGGHTALTAGEPDVNQLVDLMR